MTYRCYASCAFGIEGVLAGELRGLGFSNVEARDARVYFDADEAGVAKANVFLRTADRVYLILDEFYARTFDELFEGVAAIDFASILPSDARFPVNANAVSSALMSVSDVQAVAKKAAVRSLGKVYGIERFAEDGSTFSIFVNIYKDLATVALNTSGAGLNRRGYRLRNVEAPLRETLAAALILISRWKSRDFYDPMCGSGTIAIEAAMLAAGMAPGLNRHFDAQNYGNSFKRAFKTAREEATDSVKAPAMGIFASDIDREAVKLAAGHAKNLGLGKYIEFSASPVNKFTQPGNPALIITNPPYAVRLGEEAGVERLYREMGRAFTGLHDTVYFILCAYEGFEKAFGRRADKKRKMYNGSLKCTYYQYFRKN